jgi:hypothetical protein
VSDRGDQSESVPEGVGACIENVRFGDREIRAEGLEIEACDPTETEPGAQRDYSES